MSTVVRQLRRPPAVTAPPGNLVTEAPPQTDGELGGDCLCGRGQAIGTCVTTATRLWFRAFHEQPAAYHLERVLDWVCVDCLADAALDVADGSVRNRMRAVSRERAEELQALTLRSQISVADQPRQTSPSKGDQVT